LFATKAFMGKAVGCDGRGWILARQRCPAKQVREKFTSMLYFLGDIMPRTYLKCTLSLLVVIVILAIVACTGLRTEFYRGETRFLYEGGRQSYSQGDYDAAGHAFESVLGIDPDYGPAHAALGNLDMIGEDYQAALIHYRQALKADPELVPEIKVLMDVASVHVARAPLTDSGIDLGQVYDLIMADRQSDLVALLEEDIPLDLLAADTMSITPDQRDELQRKIVTMAQPGVGNPRFRLWAGYLLFWVQTDDVLAAALLEDAGSQVQGHDRQQAMLVLGHLYERMGRFSLAVDRYLGAAAAGRPMAEVAHHLARVYRVDLETILSAAVDTEAVPPPHEPVRIEISGFLPKPPTPPAIRGDLVTPINIEDLQAQESPYAF
jgi:tetratricopeptide (TPR) repeat protein